MDYDGWELSEEEVAIINKVEDFRYKGYDMHDISKMLHRDERHIGKAVSRMKKTGYIAPALKDMMQIDVDNLPFSKHLTFRVNHDDVDLIQKLVKTGKRKACIAKELDLDVQVLDRILGINRHSNRYTYFGYETILKAKDYMNIILNRHKLEGAINV